MSYIEITWIRRNGHLSHLDGRIERLIGWTADEIKGCTMRDVMTASSYKRVEENYLTGPPGSIAHHALTLDMRHKDGHIVTMRFSVVCRWDEHGELVEAWGNARHVQRQREQDAVMAWWEEADPAHLDAVIEIAGMYAAL